jgi:hypothetical protein
MITAINFPKAAEQCLKSVGICYNIKQMLAPKIEFGKLTDFHKFCENDPVEVMVTYITPEFIYGDYSDHKKLIEGILEESENPMIKRYADNE